MQSEPSIPDSWGYHIRPIHFYEPLPDFRSLTTEEIERTKAHPALDFRDSEQLSLVSELISAHGDELKFLSDKKPPEFSNSFFSDLDAAIYYALIRQLKPRQVIEIGGGFSTRVANRALKKNTEEGNTGKLVCIEPYPESRLTRANLEMELINKRVEEIDTSFFSGLEKNDILFIDSSHTVKFGSDVCYEVLEILPTLNSGVWVHVHDIFLTDDYPAEWLLERRLALNEQYLLEAFLAFNSAFSIRLANHWLLKNHSEQMEQLWTENGDENKPSSFWITRN
jgi:predicted O-methyltransferase YrrM